MEAAEAAQDQRCWKQKESSQSSTRNISSNHIMLFLYAALVTYIKLKVAPYFDYAIDPLAPGILYGFSSVATKYAWTWSPPKIVEVGKKVKGNGNREIMPKRV